MLTDVEQGFLPWLMEQVEEQLSKAMLGRSLLDSVIRDVVAQRQAAYAALLEQQQPAAASSPAPQVVVVAIHTR